MGVFIMSQMLNVLYTASNTLPSLGILFTTIEKSLADMIYFTAVTSLFFLVFVNIYYISFGELNFSYSTLASSFLSNFRQLLGEMNYQKTYEADPQVSAIVLVLFVLIMNFMVLSMYTAIVIRTYHKLQARMIFLGEAMAIIVKKRARKNIQNWINLLRCRSTFTQPAKRARRNNLGDGEEDKGNTQKFSQKLSHNLNKIIKTKVMTKDKFEVALKDAAQNVAWQRHLEKSKRLNELLRSDPTENYKKLKGGCILLFHLIFSTVFYIMWAEV